MKLIETKLQILLYPYTKSCYHQSTVGQFLQEDKMSKAFHSFFSQAIKERGTFSGNNFRLTGDQKFYMCITLSDGACIKKSVNFRPHHIPSIAKTVNFS